MSALAAVRDAIARAVLGDRDLGSDARDVRIGTITLRAHQREALLRVRDAVAEFGGALLADEPGLGKTYVALALAREFPSTIVAAPAALREMWRDASARAAVPVTFVSLETLSQRAVPVRAPFVIVDEAHHACNPAAARYARIARLAAGARVLLLTATPVRNRRAELDAQLALFLGPRAAALDEAERSRCIIRRSDMELSLPAVDGPHWHAAPATPDLAKAIAGLPPPLPALDGREARALLAMTLARCWASSLGALDAALRRRLQRGAALEAVLDADRVPTRAELRAWVVGDDAVQLAFPLLVSHQAPDTVRMRDVLRAHLDAVRALRARVAPRAEPDAAARAALLLRLRADHPRERIVAFTSYAATAEALYRALRRTPGVALLTARGARSAGGARPRADVLSALGPAALQPAASRADASAFAAAPHPRIFVDDISLVVTTDVLSEGVNLQGASVVVHLDIPWTPSSLDQRVGRAARIGSPHARVHVHGFAPPAAAERLLTLKRRLLRKHAEGLTAVRASTETERLRARVARWRLREPAARGAPIADSRGEECAARVAGARGARDGFVAVLREGGKTCVVVGIETSRGRQTVSDDPHDVRTLLEAIVPEAGPCDARRVAGARRALDRWLAHRSARAASGSWSGASSAARRRVLAQLDRLLGRAPPATRASLHLRIARLRALVAACAGAGAERILGELAAAERDGGTAWLDDVERLLEPIRTSPRDNAKQKQPVVEALLIVSSRRVRACAAPGP